MKRSGIRFERIPLLGLLTLPLAQAAGAEVVEVWSELSLRMQNLGNVEASASATGLATIHTSSTSSSHLATITLSGQSLNTTVNVTDPYQAPIEYLRFDVRNRPDLQGGGVIGNVSGAIAGSGGGLTPNTIPMTGGVTLCLIDEVVPCVGRVGLPVGATSGSDRIGNGIGGILTVGGTGSLQVSILGAPYTVGTVSVAARTANGIDVRSGRGFAHGPLSLTSSTALPSGVLQIVTASHVAYVGPGDQDIGGSITHILVQVIPEPALFALLGFGTVLVAWLGHRRRRR